MIKKIFTSIIILIILNIWYCFAVPSLSSLSDTHNWYSSTLWVEKDNTLKQNIMELFFPSSNGWWRIWTKLMYIFTWLVFIFFLWAWALFVLNADDDWELKKAKSNILYLFYWSFLIFWSVWLLWNVLNIWWNWTTASWVITATQNNIIWTILIFFKSLAYYIAFILIVYYGFKMMQAQEKEDKVKTAKNWILNIILALIAIKVLDYIYYIAQTSSFVSKWSSLIVWTWKVLAWSLWVIIILSLLYAAWLLITSRWDAESMKKSKNIIRNVFLAVFVIFLFIVIIFDLVKNFSH